MYFQTAKLLQRTTKMCRFCSKDVSTETKKLTTVDYIIKLVRSKDYENYLCTLLLPQSILLSGMAIRAFNVELAQVQSHISELHSGIMRLKFWEETINQIYNDKPPQHPVAIELYKAVKRHDLPKRHFLRLINARASTLNLSTFKTIKDLEKYADDTNTPVYFLLLEAAGVKNVNYDHLASHLGKAQGTLNLIRGLRHNMIHKTLLLPQDLLAEHDISEESIYRGSMDSEKFKDVIFRIATISNNNLKKARDLHKELKIKDLNLLFLPGVSTGLFLKKLELNGFDPFNKNFCRQQGFLPFRLYWNKFKGKF